MSKTSIAWASHSWNPYSWNCERISPGCKNCYMMALAERRGHDPNGPITTRWDAAERELKAMKSGAVIFVNSMSDTYHNKAKGADIHRIHNMALSHPENTFLLLTKRPERAYHMRETLAWPGNLWLGVSVENGDYLWRIDYALATPAAGVFVSAEPLLGDIGVRLLNYLHGMNYHNRPSNTPYEVWKAGQFRAVGWVIVGGESGRNRRALDRDWVRSIMHSCAQHEIPFMFKQGSAHRPGQDRYLDGRMWDEMPAEFMARGAIKQAGPLSEQRPYQLGLF